MDLQNFKKDLINKCYHYSVLIQFFYYIKKQFMGFEKQNFFELLYRKKLQKKPSIKI